MPRRRGRISGLVVSSFVGCLKCIAWCLWSPIRIFLSVRRSMTSASVVLLLFGIISVNIVWGYPWTGVFSACTALFLVGLGFSRLFRPNLHIDTSLPTSVAAGQSFSLITHLRNQRQLPAMDLEIEPSPARSPKRRRRWFRKSAATAVSEKVAFESLSKRTFVPLLLPQQRYDIHGTIVFHRRGLHDLPDLVITSMFPFHLFRSRTRHRVNASIAVTPALLSGSEDIAARQQLSAVGSWSRKLLAGDALDYTGSREYQVGMPVRRWDFASWARLGRPIIREFQSPSIRTLTLIVDTAVDRKTRLGKREEIPAIERTLSLAATALTDLSRKNVRAQMFVTSEQGAELDESLSRIESGSAGDLQSLLTRLATAKVVSPKESKIVFDRAIELLGSSPTLILTSRQAIEFERNLPPSISILRIDPDHDLDEIARPGIAQAMAEGPADVDGSKKSKSDAALAEQGA